MSWTFMGVGQDAIPSSLTGSMATRPGSSFSDHVMEGVVHEMLEGGQGVGHPKEHYEGFKESSVCCKCSFPLVSVFDMHVVVPPTDVELGEDLRSLEFVDEVGDKGEWVGVTDGVFIEISVILTGA